MIIDFRVSRHFCIFRVFVVTCQHNHSKSLISVVSFLNSKFVSKCNYLPMMRGEKLMEKYFHVVENIINRETILLSRETFQPQNFTDFQTK